MNNRSRKLHCKEAEINQLASSVLDEHVWLLEKGFRLCKSTSFTLTRRGDVTARLVYRSGRPTRDTIVFVLRGCPVMLK